jgi:hypothetical protein
MPQMMSIILNGDGCWPDLVEKRAKGELIDLMGNDVGNVLQVAALPKGTVSGNTTVTLRLDLPDGKTVMTEVSLKLWRAALEAFEARYGRAY